MSPKSKTFSISIINQSPLPQSSNNKPSQPDHKPAAMTGPFFFCKQVKYLFVLHRKITTTFKMPCFSSWILFRYFLIPATQPFDSIWSRFDGCSKKKTTQRLTKIPKKKKRKRDANGRAKKKETTTTSTETLIYIFKLHPPLRNETQIE